MDELRVEERILQALRRLNLTATVGELVTLTGLGREQIQRVLPRIVSERRGHYQVTESGEIVFTFPRGLTNVARGFRARLWRAFRGALDLLRRILVILFKVWIMVMLVGYFLLFVTIVVLFTLLFVTATLGSRSKRRNDGSDLGHLVFALITNVIDTVVRFWLYSRLFDATDPRERGGRRGAPKTPFHEAVFRFEFGTEDVVPPWEEEARRQLVYFIRRNKGVLTLEEIQLFLGVSREEADRIFSRLLLDYEGDVRVTDAGAIYGWFPRILEAIREDELGKRETSALPPPIPRQPFSGNPKGITRWIVVFSVVNLVFGSLFCLTAFPHQHVPPELLILPAMVYSLLLHAIGDPVARIITGVGLGLVPLVFSLLFLTIPLVRWMVLKRRNQRIEARNARMRFLRTFMGSPSGVENPSKVEENFLRDFAAGRRLEVAQIRDRMRYTLPQYWEERASIQSLRDSIDPRRYRMGETVFDTNT